MRFNRRFWSRAFLGLVTFGVLIQLVPYGRTHANPVIQTEAKWDSPTTRALFDRACADCHSNRTTWPWYSNVAPVSWLIQTDVDGGRKKFNINVQGFGEAGNAAEVIQNGKMPESSYLPLHPDARLSAAETAQLIAGVRTTFGTEGGQSGQSSRGLAELELQAQTLAKQSVEDTRGWFTIKPHIFLLKIVLNKAKRKL